MNYCKQCCKCKEDIPYGTPNYHYTKKWRKIHRTCECCKDESLEQISVDSFTLCIQCSEELDKILYEFCDVGESY